MKSIITALFMALILNTGVAFAHGGHGKISAKQALQVAAKTTQQLTFKDFGFKVGKLDESWKTLTAEDFKLLGVEANRYVISAVNKTENKKIYFLMTMTGEMLQINSEGKF
mgnify:FL=1|jgi:hypothetical protein